MQQNLFQYAPVLPEARPGLVSSCILLSLRTEDSAVRALMCQSVLWPAAEPGVYVLEVISIALLPLAVTSFYGVN